MDDLYHRLATALCAGEKLVLAVIVRQSGSTPRGPGTAMLLLENGQWEGTVGGGSVEQAARQMARDALENGRSFVHSFSLDSHTTQSHSSGKVQILFAALSGKDPAHQNTAEALCRLLPTDCWLMVSLSTAGQASPALLGPGGILAGNAEFLEGYDGSLAPLLQERPVLHSGHKHLIFSLPMAEPGRAFVFGGGHVAQSLVPLLAGLNFHCILVDDRAELANSRVFPLAQEILCAPFPEVLPQLSLTSRDYIAVMTREPASDYLVLAEVLRSPAQYIGMLGSHKKAYGIRNQLMAERGFGHRELGRIRTPIGLPLGGESPAEVALSIAAEMVMVRSGKPPLR